MSVLIDHWPLALIGLALALAIGSFCSVVVDRLPWVLDEPNQHGELVDTRPWAEVLGGRSRCPHCAAPVRPVDNLPILSYLLLRGRCRNCGEGYGAFHLLVELSVPLLALWTVWAVGWNVRLLPFVVIIPALVMVGFVDARHMIVPTRVVWPAFAAILVLSGLAVLWQGELRWLSAAAIGAVAVAGPLAALWFFSPRAMGFGDVRLAVLLGWAAGWVVGGAPVLAPLAMAVLLIFVAALVGVVVGVPLVGLRGRIPFGPSLVAALFLILPVAAPLVRQIGPA